jgi:hypothetical protein
MKIKVFLLTLVMMVIFVASIYAQSNSNAPHCAAELAPVSGTFDPQNARNSEIIRQRCFATMAEAAEYATGGRVSLSRTASADEVVAALENNNRNPSSSRGNPNITPQAIYTLAWYYDQGNLNGSGGTLTISSSSLCTTQNYYAADLNNLNQGNWRNRISSWQRASGSGCTNTYFYQYTNYAGTWNYCPSQCMALPFNINNDADSLILVQ